MLSRLLTPLGSPIWGIVTLALWASWLAHLHHPAPQTPAFSGFLSCPLLSSPGFGSYNYMFSVTSRPLHGLFPLPGAPFPPIFTWLTLVMPQGPSLDVVSFGSLPPQPDLG